MDDALHPTFFARAEIAGLDVDAALARYAAWALGLAPFERVRERRLELGVSAKWSAEDLLAGAELRGRDDCEIEIERDDEGAAAFWFVHQDDEDDEVLWETTARFAPLGTGVAIEHGVARTAPAGHAVAPLAAPPAVLVRLLDEHRAAVAPRELGVAAPLLLGARDVRAWVERALAAPSRGLEVLVVSMPDASAIDATRLARALRGTATVACLRDVEATMELESAARALACPVAGARLIGVGDAAGEGPGWGSDALGRVPMRARAATLAAWATAAVVERRTPGDFFG